MLRYLQSPYKFKHNVEYTWINKTQEKPSSLNFYVDVVTHSLSDIIKMGYDNFKEKTSIDNINLEEFLKKILYGELMKWNIV